MYTYEMKNIIHDAETTLRAADNCADDIAYILKNRLKSGNVRHSTLCALKKELENYNMHTGRWKK